MTLETPAVTHNTNISDRRKTVLEVINTSDGKTQVEEINTSDGKSGVGIAMQLQ